KVLCFYHPDDDDAIKADQEATLLRLAFAARHQGLELLVELIPSQAGSIDHDTTAAVMRRVYGIGIKPDWWKLEPVASETAWKHVSSVVEEHDPWCRGIVLLGLGASSAELGKNFATAARHPLVKGFAVGRTLFADAAKAWFADEIDDRQAVAMMAENYGRLAEAWDRAKANAAAAQTETSAARSP
ncbi:MAG: DUF2090 domain-containing protein, partial [Alphaproteobacteria bacterium]|nr:DUF2090 domain-containing protein [Alphaproteobacteria bacterium]